MRPLLYLDSRVPKQRFARSYECANPRDAPRDAVHARGKIARERTMRQRALASLHDREAIDAFRTIFERAWVVLSIFFALPSTRSYDVLMSSPRSAVRGGLSIPHHSRFDTSPTPSPPLRPRKPGRQSIACEGFVHVRPYPIVLGVA